MELADYRVRQAQAALVREQSRQQSVLEAQRVYAAYVQLETNESFQIVLNYWIQRVLLVEITTEHDMGKHNFVVGVLQDMRNAAEAIRLGGNGQA